MMDGRTEGWRDEWMDGQTDGTMRDGGKSRGGRGMSE